LILFGHIKMVYLNCTFFHYSLPFKCPLRRVIYFGYLLSKKYKAPLLG
jgi:hypothetical protein